MNSAKAYLNRVKALDTKINHLIEERDDLRLIATGNSSPRLDPNKVQTSGGGDVMARNVERYVELENHITKLIDRYVDMKDRVIREIHALDDPRYVEILYQRYIKFRRFEEIAVLMNYNFNYIRQLHGNALNEFGRIHNI